MKLAKLSLAAIVVAGLASSSFAADTLADAFKNGKVNGELKAYYFTVDDGKKDADIFSTGVLLGYKTDSFYGFSLGLTAQGSASPYADHDGKNMFASTMYGPGAVLSESYIAYTVGKTTAMVGRMFLDTPLVSGAGSRVIKEAFEGAAVINTDLPNTTLIAGYVDRFQGRTDRSGTATDSTNVRAGKFSKNDITTNSSTNVNLDNGAFTLAAINKSIPGLTLTAAYAYADAEVAGGHTPSNVHSGIFTDVSIAYVEALYEGKAGEIGYTLGLQDYYNYFDGLSKAVSPDDSINLYAVKVGLSFKGVNGTVAYSKVSDDNIAGNMGLASGLGNGADLLYTDALISLNGYNRDTASYLLDLNYDVTAAANIGVRYVLNDGYLGFTSNPKKASVTSDKYKADSTAVYGSYKFEGALKGFSLGVQYESQGKDVDGDDLWVKANYKF